MDYLSFLSPYSDVMLSIFRISLGIVFIVHGRSKIKDPAAFAKGIGAPVVNGYIAAICEFFGGLGLLLGFFTPIAALMAAAVMIGALHYHINVWKHPFSNPGSHSYELPFILLVACLLIATIGGGSIALDYLLL